MKRFRWPLQRLLDVTCQREQALRTSVLALSQELALLRRHIDRQRAVLQRLLQEIAAQDIERRMAQQEVFMTCSRYYERSIDSLRQRLREIDSRRAAKMKELFNLRARRKAMERLRGEAMAQYLRGQAHLEQKEFDDSAGVAFARKAAAPDRRRLTRSEP